jgi:hypothetical protein
MPLEYRLEAKQGMNVLVVEGEIGADASARLDQIVQQLNRERKRIDEVWFNSPGGNGNEGLAMGRIFRARGLATRIPNGFTCFSACSYAFIGGVIRNVDLQGCYGVHMFTEFNEQTASRRIEEATQGRQSAASQDLLRMIQEWEQNAAVLARMRAKYLIEMSISLELMTPAFDTRARGAHWLTPDELRRYNIVNTR